MNNIKTDSVKIREFSCEINCSCELCKFEIERDTKEYLKMPFKEWDKDTIFYSQLTDECYDDVWTIADIADYYEIGYSALRLVICEPEKPNQIDPNVIFAEYIPEGFGFDEIASENVKIALANLNKALEEEGPWIWKPGNYRTDYKGETVAKKRKK